MTNRELINELKQQCCRVNATKAKMAYRLIANELLLQIPEAKILRSRPNDLLEEAISNDPERLQDYSGTDMFYYHFVALLPDGRAVRFRADSSLERFRVYRLYWQEEPEPARYGRESHIAHDGLVCNRSNSNIAKAINKLAAREPKLNCRAPTIGELNEYLNDQYN